MGINRQVILQENSCKLDNAISHLFDNRQSITHKFNPSVPSSKLTPRISHHSTLKSQTKAIANTVTKSRHYNRRETKDTIHSTIPNPTFPIQYLFNSP